MVVGKKKILCCEDLFHHFLLFFRSLGLLLSLNHDLFVSGIDAMGFDAHAQEGRQSKLQKTYNAEVKKVKKIEEKQEMCKSTKFYRTTHYISGQFNVQEIVDSSNKHFERSFNSCPIGLVGELKK